MPFRKKWFLISLLLPLTCFQIAQAKPPLGGSAKKRKPMFTSQYLDLPGVDKKLLSLDVYGFNSGSSPLAPIIFYVHGGAWRIGDKARVGYKADYFNQLGYVFISTNYQLSPKVIHPAHVQSIAHAFRWVVNNARQFGGRPDKIALLGHSAGAHLVALLALSPNYLNSVNLKRSHVSCTISLDSTAYDIPTAYSNSSAKKKTILEQAFGTNKDIWAEASPITHISNHSKIGPFFLVRRGTKKRKALTEKFYSALLASSIPTKLVDTTGMSHSQVNKLIGAPSEKTITPPLTQFLKNCFAK